jgi:hypothetical protein
MHKGFAGLIVGRPGCLCLLPSDVERAAAGVGLLGKEAIEDPQHVHHAVVLPEVVLWFGQKRVVLAVAS